MTRLGAVSIALAATLGCSTGTSQPPLPNQHADRSTDVSQKELLREIAHKAAAAPDANPNFTLSYMRGHALAGVTEFTMTAAGTYSLDSNVTAGRRKVHFDGQLTPAHRDAVLALINQHDLLATPPSSRNIGDDEEPIIIKVSDGDLRYELKVWHHDAMKLTAFHAFEQGLIAVIRELSGGAVLDTVTY